MRTALLAFLTAIALLAALGALVSVGGILDAFASYQHEPEDFHLVLFWALLSLAVFSYCVFGLFRGLRKQAFHIGTASKAVSAVVFVLGAFIVVAALTGANDKMLIVPGLLVALSPFAYVGLGRT